MIKSENNYSESKENQGDVSENSEGEDQDNISPKQSVNFESEEESKSANGFHESQKSDVEKEIDSNRIMRTESIYLGVKGILNRAKKNKNFQDSPENNAMKKTINNADIQLEI